MVDILDNLSTTAELIIDSTTNSGTLSSDILIIYVDFHTVGDRYRQKGFHFLDTFLYY